MSLIKEMPIEEMPFERLKKYGPEVLTDTELLAVLIRNGTVKASPVGIARRVLTAAGEVGLIGLMNVSWQKLTSVEGIGEVKALQIAALGEITKRISTQYAKSRIMLSDPESVAEYYMEQLRYLSEEQVWVGMFDSKFQLIASRMVTRGIANSSLVTPREVYRLALEDRAVSIILIHNHPSGDPSPSSSDIELTKQMDEAGRIMGIEMADHIIIGDNTYFSMKEHGYK